MRAMQHTQFCAKSVKNVLKPMGFLKRDFYFETEGVYIYTHTHALSLPHIYRHNVIDKFVFVHVGLENIILGRCRN